MCCRPKHKISKTVKFIKFIKTIKENKRKIFLALRKDKIAENTYTHKYIYIKSLKYNRLDTSSNKTSDL